MAIRSALSVHPGEFLRTEIIGAHNLSVTDAAHYLKVTRQALSSLLNSRSSLTPDMAIRFEKAFGVDADTLLRMQLRFDIAEARKREDNIKVERYHAAA